MEIIRAEKKDLAEIMKFYDIMCQVLGEKSFMPGGNKGGFPSETMVEEAIRTGSQFIGVEDGRIMAAYILNHECDDSYRKAHWHISAGPDEAVVMHALRVLPEYGGRGYSKRLLEHAIRTARERGQKAIRLDCLKENEIADRLYRSFGFEYVDTVEIMYADIGVPRQCLLYELILK